MPGNRPHHTDKWRSCVQQVEEKGTGDPYAICTAQLGPSIESAELDDANGDRGDVAPPAGHMPRSMASRCMSCGADASIYELRDGACRFCGASLAETPVTESATHPPNPNHVEAPKGSAPAPGKSIGPIHVAPSAVGQ